MNALKEQVSCAQFSENQQGHNILSEGYFWRKEELGWIVYGVGDSEYYFYPFEERRSEILQEIINGTEAVKKETKSKIAGMKEYRLSAPLRVYYDITYECNLNCIYCYNKDKKDTQKRYLNLAEKMSLLAQMKELGILKLSIAGGEPFIDKDLHPFVERAHELGINVSITSNGTKIKERDIDFIKKGFFKRITISLDGAEAKLNCKRIGCKSETVINTIKTILAKTEVDLAVKMVIDIDCDIKDIMDMVDFAEANHIKTVKISFLRKEINISILNNKLYINKYFELINKINEIRKKIKIDMTGPSSVFGNSFGIPNCLFGHWCSAGKDLLYVNPYGDVKPCVMLDDNFICGNIITDSIGDIWKSKFSEIFSTPAGCNNCAYINNCFGGCRARAIQSFGRKDAPDVFCYRKIENDYNKELINNNLKNTNDSFKYCLTHL